MNSNYMSEAYELIDQLEAIDYEQLPISDYNKQYIATLKASLLYHFQIYSFCLTSVMRSINNPVRFLTFVDYGGGSGFLSILAKKVGFGRVIYIDLNPQSVETVKVLKEQLGMGPDVILQGDSDTLAAWCAENKKKPEILISTDVIEHIYDLRKFFADLTSINEDMVMLFTTASTPFNPRIKRRLERQMKEYEKGGKASPNYYELRKEYIAQNYPDIKKDEDELEHYATITRGLTFTDISYLLDNRHQIETVPLERFPMFIGPYNTCDPRNGNWMERILFPNRYNDFLKPHNFHITLVAGFYKMDRKNFIAKFCAKFTNFLIYSIGKYGLLIAPFIILYCSRKQIK